MELLYAGEQSLKSKINMSETVFISSTNFINVDQSIATYYKVA